MTTHPAEDEKLLAHNWRVARLTRLGVPGALAEVCPPQLALRIARPADRPCQRGRAAPPERGARLVRGAVAGGPPRRRQRAPRRRRR